jgi:hypothetical protein
MSNRSQIEQEFDDSYETDIADDDYGFIIGPDGELKTLFLPDNVPFKAPKNIEKILKILGINDISNVDQDQTIH